MALLDRPEATHIPTRRPWNAVLTALRPRQWPKNFVLFAGIVFAAEIGNGERWLQALAAFVAYCFASSASYLLNDVVDVASDRLHPVKKRRPVARGEVTVRTALALAAVLVVLAFILAASLGLASLLLMAVFVAVQVAYSLGLKHVVLVDVMTISGLFVLRAAAGAAAVNVRISPWLLLCTALLALFLAVGKRRSELVLVSAGNPAGRHALAGYSLPLIEQGLAAVAGASVIAYAIYAVSAHSQLMVLTIPFVVFGVFRYLVLVQRRDIGEEPEEVFLTDAPILAAVALWVATAGIILTVT